MSDSLGSDLNRAAAAPPAINAPLRNLDADIQSLLRPFLEQSALPRSIVAVARPLGTPSIGAAHEATLLRLVADEAGSAIVALEPLRLAGGPSLARQACEVAGEAPGNDLLLSPLHVLHEIMPPLAEDFGFRAVAVFVPPARGPLGGGNAWKLRRILFDRGLICIGSTRIAGCQVLCFLASGDLQDMCRLNVEPRGQVTMATLTEGGRFANQLFRYAAVKLYALRHGLRVAVPEWEGRQLFGLDDKSSEGIKFHRLTFAAFTHEDRELWGDDPPKDIDLQGYFQELPACWRKHRPLLRRLFQLPPEQREAIDAWRHDVTHGGQRTLVAIHVRRGDYRRLQRTDSPWFRLVPEEWYLQWLRSIWPALREPLLFVATDDPETVLPVFQEFEMVRAPAGSMAGSMAGQLPEHVLDFEILRRADYLAMCNSSYSRMAAILAPDTQHCFLPSFGTQRFESYDPWTDSAYWARFADTWGRTRLRGDRRLEGPAEPAAIFIDLSDLLHHLFHHTTLSGIQRVQCELLRNLLDGASVSLIHFVVFRKQGGIATIEPSALLKVIDELRFGTAPRAELEAGLLAVLNGAIPCTLLSQDIFLTLGAFWNMKGIGARVQELKNSGVTIGLFIHDILPIVAPEYFDARETAVFVKGVSELLTFADFIFTSSAYNRGCLATHLACRNLEPLPIKVVPLSHEFPAPIEATISSAVASVVRTGFVLAVGTIEARKNPGYLFNVWKMMVSSGRPNIPYLVFAGRKGWLVQDVLDQMKACNYLGGRIVLLHNVTDCELDLLYRNCMLTMFPSLIEGWGLPVGESLAHGKICLCSGMGGIRDAGGELGDYIDAYNSRDGYEQLVRYLDDPELRRGREREIADRFEPRSWRKVTGDLLRSVHAVARQVRPFEGVAAVALPPGRYLPIGSEAVAVGTDGVDARLSTELVCVSGWAPPEASGVRAIQPATMLRFRADAAPGTKINLALRLAAYGLGFRIRIRAGSGAQTEVSLSRSSESLAVLPCEVEPGKLVTAELSLLDEGLDEAIGAAFREDEVSGASCWMLKGILYFDPKSLAGEAVRPAKEACGTTPPPATGSRILLGACAMGDWRRAASLAAFRQTPNSFWPSNFTTDRAAPFFADDADRLAFDSGCGNPAYIPQVGRIQDSVKMIRRTDQFVSMSRFSEGSVFDRLGVWRALGYLQHSPAGATPWLSKEGDGVRIAEDTLARAPVYKESCLIFYNGNLHNYYHWLVEGLLGLDILSQALQPISDFKILLPKSMDIHARFDHRETLRALGFGGHAIEEVAADCVKVREAIWLDSDLVQAMPAPYLKAFQQRLAAQYAGLRGPRKRRLLIARKGPSRCIHNIGQVQDFLSRYDFETVYTEGLRMLDQILLFQSAEFIIGPHGAGLANLLFCDPGTKVIELMPSVEFRSFFWAISEKLGLAHGLQFCAPVGGQGFQDAIHVDTGKLETLMRRMEAQLVRRVSFRRA